MSYVHPDMTYPQGAQNPGAGMGVHRGETQHAERLKMTRSATERVKQFARARRHHYVVVALRMLLPVLILLTASLYYVGQFFVSGLEVNLAGVTAKIGKIAVDHNSLKMEHPSLKGYDEKQGAYQVNADAAVQDVSAPHIISLQNIRAKVDHPDKKVSFLTADTGVFDTKKETLKLKGDIRGKMSEDLQFKMMSADIDMKRKTIESAEPVEAEMLNGTVRSDTLYADTNERMIFFKGRVKVQIKSLRRKKDIEKSAQAGNAEAGAGKGDKQDEQ